MDTTTALPRRIRLALTNQHGKYTFADLPPGEYLIAAVASDELSPNSDRVDTRLLPRLARVATPIRLDYDAPLAHDLRHNPIQHPIQQGEEGSCIL
jgi:hypothetical protein